MGTNYYYYPEKKCEHCHRVSERRHIGKSSIGWMFILRIYPDDNIMNLDDWFKLFAAPGSYIEDEYGEIVDVEYMIRSIKRENATNLLSHEKHFNHYGVYSRRGEGNWDYLNGEFS